MPDGVRLLRGADAPALRSLLDRDPVSYAMVTERLDQIGLGGALGAEVWGWFAGQELVSALYNGANAVPVAADSSAVQAFAIRARNTPRRCSSIVGPSHSVTEFERALGDRWGTVRAIRPRQPLMVIPREPLVPPDPGVRVATREDLPLLFPACVAMFTEELGISPLGTDGGAGYRRRVQWLIDQGRALVRTDGAEVVFKAEIGVLAGGVGQVQGVWVHPDLRGRGLCAPGMSALVGLVRRRLAPTVSLYVNDFNLPAIAAYRRVGFEQVGEFATILY